MTKSIMELEYMTRGEFVDYIRKHVFLSNIDDFDLTSREKQIICLRFGIGEEKPCTLEGASKLYNVTRERIRQIEAKALRKIRKVLKMKEG